MKLTAGSIIGGIVGLMVVFLLLANLLPTAQDAGEQLQDDAQCERQDFYWNTSMEACTVSEADITEADYNATPLASLFGGAGIIFLLLMVGVLVGAIGWFGFSKK